MGALLASRLMLKLISFPLIVISLKFVNFYAVENYSEIDWFDFEMRMRKLVHELMEPSFKQNTEDRSMVKKL